MKKVTLKQIAELADTSIGTVDRALNNRGRISEETKQKILQIADQLGYRPNKLASSLSRSRAIRLGILYPAYPAYFFDEMTAGVMRPLTYSQTTAWRYIKSAVIPSARKTRFPFGGIGQ